MHKLQVVAVDDSKTIRRLIEAILGRANCEVFTAINGFDALAKVVDIQPDIVLLDIMMPRLNGYQTCSIIKNNRTLQKIPIVLLSSKNGVFDKARGRASGCNGYLTKPFSRQELIQTINTAETENQCYTS